MKKYLVLISIVMVLAFAGTVIAEEQFFPPRNNTGQIGKSGRVWREGNFYTLNSTDANISATADIGGPFSNIVYLQPASKNFGSATAIWELSATEAKAHIIYAFGASPNGAQIVAPSVARAYTVFNNSSYPVLFRATGQPGLMIATTTAQKVIYMALTGSTSDYVLAGASFPVRWGP